MISAIVGRLCKYNNPNDLKEIYERLREELLIWKTKERENEEVGEGEIYGGAIREKELIWRERILRKRDTGRGILGERKRECVVE